MLITNDFQGLLCDLLNSGAVVQNSSVWVSLSLCFFVFFQEFMECYSYAGRRQGEDRWDQGWLESVATGGLCQTQNLITYIWQPCW